MDITELKRSAGEQAASYVKEGMTLGLGTGSTTYYFILKLGELVQTGLHILCVPSSEKTAELARKQGISLTDFTKVSELDLTIDGADEVDPQCNLIKGGGGALLGEKIVAAASKKFYVIVDETKLKKQLGTAPLPVEVVPFSWPIVQRKLEDLGCHAQLREQNGKVFVTDNGNYILDCHFKRIADPIKLEQEIDTIPGVVESGLFINMADKIIIGLSSGQVEERNCARATVEPLYDPKPNREQDQTNQA